MLVLILLIGWGGGGFLSEPLNTKVRFRKTRISEGF